MQRWNKTPDHRMTARQRLDCLESGLKLGRAERRSAYVHNLPLARMHALPRIFFHAPPSADRLNTGSKAFR